MSKKNKRNSNPELPQSPVAPIISISNEGSPPKADDRKGNCCNKKRDAVDYITLLIGTVTLIVIAIYTFINIKLYESTSQSFRAAQRPVLVLDTSHVADFGSEGPEKADRIMIYFKNLGHEAAIQPFVEGWIAIPGKKDGFPPPGLVTGFEAVIVAIDGTFTGYVLIGNSGMNRTVPAAIGGRIRYEETTDIFLPTFWQRVFSVSPVQYCDSFMVQYLPQSGFRPMPGGRNYCTPYRWEPFGLEGVWPPQQEKQREANKQHSSQERQ